MIDYASFFVANFTQSTAFYDATMPLLGYEQIMLIDNADFRMVAYGTNGRPYFWLVGSTEETEHDASCTPPFQIGITAPSVEAIEKWHAHCIEMGAQEVNAPMHQPELHPGYYSARIIDQNGVQIEAVLHNFTA
jgi:catechol 2,3-dioxygenase-like lactoylglutathione lyase family enzyme